MLRFLLKMRLKSCLKTILVLLTLILSFYGYYFCGNYVNTNLEFVPIMVLWTPLLKSNYLKEINCGQYQCILTENRDYINNTKTLAFMFYGSSFLPYDLPLPRKHTHLWTMIHEESPKNLALFLYEDAQLLFNYTSTFSRFSNFPITLQYLPSIELLIGTEYFYTTNQKNELLTQLSPVLYIQSDCTTPLERDAYVLELMKYISIDSYGQCLNNKQLPEKFANNWLQNLFEPEFLRFVAQYKFVISFENAICDDYITEKLWRPLITGSVPIYLGSPSIQDWLPNNNSAIFPNEFESPQKLAEYLHQINKNDSLYETFLFHKRNSTITNKLLSQQLLDRNWGVENQDTHFFDAFECFVCEKIHSTSGFEQNGKSGVYSCPIPVSPLTGRRNESNWWTNHWTEGRCQAKVLHRFLLDPRTNSNFTRVQFEDETARLLRENGC